MILARHGRSWTGGSACGRGAVARRPLPWHLESPPPGADRGAALRAARPNSRPACANLDRVLLLSSRAVVASGLFEVQVRAPPRSCGIAFCRSGWSACSPGGIAVLPTIIVSLVSSYPVFFSFDRVEAWQRQVRTRPSSESVRVADA